MASIPPNTCVIPRASEFANLRFPPKETGVLAIAVHPGALRVPTQENTLVVQLDGTGLVWAGSVDESMLSATDATLQNARSALAQHILTGPNLGKVVTPGHLHKKHPGKATTVYQGSRPWIVLGACHGSILAAPLNHGPAKKNKSGHDPLYQVTLEEEELLNAVDSPQVSKLELNHLWALPATVHQIGVVAKSTMSKIAQRTRSYFGVQPGT